MHSLLQPWLCHVALFSLATFSFVSGCALEIGVRSSSLAVRHYLGNQPIPTVTQWFFELYTEHTHSLLTLSFYPTLIAAAYLFILFRRTADEQERCARFAVMALVAFIAIFSFLLLGGFSFALPFLPHSGGMLKFPAPPTPGLQQAIWLGLLLLVAACILLFVRLLISPSRPAAAPNKTDGH
jgi:hypothetical protein